MCSSWGRVASSGPSGWSLRSPTCRRLCPIGHPEPAPTLGGGLGERTAVSQLRRVPTGGGDMNCPHWTLRSRVSLPWHPVSSQVHGGPRGPRSGGGPWWRRLADQVTTHSSPSSLHTSAGLSVPNLTGPVAVMLGFPFLIITAFPWTLFCHT